jgi:hypothetical protein
VGGISERGKELKRRRHRRKKIQKLYTKLRKSNPAERAPIAEKVRALTPGAEEIIKNWGIKGV